MSMDYNIEKLAEFILENHHAGLVMETLVVWDL